MKKKITAVLLLCMLLISAGCSDKKSDTAAAVKQTVSSTAIQKTETRIHPEYMLKYKDKKISQEYYEYMLSANKYDFLDTYIAYAKEYALRGYDFGRAYFGTEVADTEDFWYAVMEEDGQRITVADIVKKQALTFAKCVSVFDDVIKDTGYSFSENVKEKADQTLKSRVGDNADNVLAKFGVSKDDALYAELVSAGLNELKAFVSKKGGAAEVTDEMINEELSKSVRYKAVSYYGADAETTDKKAKASYDRIMDGTSDFSKELQNSDDYSELTGEYADGTILSKEEFYETFDFEKDDISFEHGEIFTASNGQGSYVIMISEFTDNDKTSAYSSVQSKTFSAFLRSYTSDIEIDEEAINDTDFLKIARIAPDSN